MLVKIIDYGVAKVMVSDPTLRQTQAGFIGTPAFASPEQFNDAGPAASRHPLGYLLVGHCPLVSAYWPDAFRRTIVARGASKAEGAASP